MTPCDGDHDRRGVAVGQLQSQLSKIQPSSFSSHELLPDLRKNPALGTSTKCTPMLAMRMVRPEHLHDQDTWFSRPTWLYQAFAVWGHTNPEIKQPAEFRGTFVLLPDSQKQAPSL